MKERIQKILAVRGVASRRNAEEMILAGRVYCNGAICTLGQKADPDIDVILVDGKQLPAIQRQIYIMLNKPRGYVTTASDEKGRKNVVQLVEQCGCRVYPVGRLDMDSEGLLLLTNDGDFANRVMHPSHEINKVYEVLVDGYSEETRRLVERRIVLDGYRIQQPEVKVLSVFHERACLQITIHEGRNRQVRRMCAAAGMRVKRLLRIGEGSLSLGELPSGQWRFLTQEEINDITK